MNVDEFIEFFLEIFEDIEQESINGDTEFKLLEQWDSLAALNMIAMIDQEYSVTITGKDIMKVNTVSELVDLIVAKKQKIITYRAGGVFSLGEAPGFSGIPYAVSRTARPMNKAAQKWLRDEKLKTKEKMTTPHIRPARPNRVPAQT